MLMYQLKVRKKEIFIIIFILLFALITTYHIYHKFEDSAHVDYNSSTLDVTFHETKGDQINIKRITPVTDSVGLSSKSHTFTIKNNTNANLKYSIVIDNNKDLVIEDDCSEIQIPHNIVRFSIHKKGEKNNIYSLSDLVNGVVLTRIIKANSEEDYTMRFWISGNSIQTGSKLHYHGLIKVNDLGTQVAFNK